MIGTLIGRFNVTTTTTIDPCLRVQGIIIRGTDEDVEIVLCTHLLQDDRFNFHLIKDSGNMMGLRDGDGVLEDKGMDLES